MAKKYFGDENPLGEILTYVNRDAVFQLSVTGVMKDVPTNSHMHPEFIASLSTFKPGTWHWIYDIPTSWDNLFYRSYILLQKGSDYKALEARLPAFLEKHMGETATKVRIAMQPLTDIHLHSNLISEFEANASMQYLYIFASIAMLILLVACINYMNLTTARSFKRVKEVGLRKTLGSHRRQLIGQFYCESFLMTACALLIALPVIDLIMPFFNQLSGKSLQLRLMDNLPTQVFLGGFLLIVGLVAGSYPALYLSRFHPTNALRGQNNKGGGKGHPLFRKMLVVFQFATTIFLIVSTFLISNQLHFFRQGRLSTGDDVVICLPLRGNDVFGGYANYKNAILQNSNIISAAGSSHIPFTEHKSGTYNLPEILGTEARFESDYFVVDSDFGKLFSLDIAYGRDFSEERDGNKNSKSFILNERAVKELGISNEEIVGKQLDDPGWDASGQVVGVVKDIHYRSLHSEISPLVIKMDPKFVRFLSVRVQSQNLNEHLLFLEDNWHAFFSNSPFYYTFLDDELSRLYASEEKVSQLFNLFTAIAIAISCLGLFGLAAFAAEQRTKELGIRKVLGASVSGVVALLSKEFVKLVLLANFIAWPVAWLAMNRWLEDFAYLIELSIWPFISAGSLALLLALLTVSFQSVKAALANPVDSLKFE